MKQKLIQLGSIGAVVVLILVSFNSVVSYQSTELTSKKTSPLFSIRTRRAIKEESKDALTSNYVGKDRGITIPLPTRDDRTVLFQKFIDAISKMDDKEFNRFMELVISRMPRDNRLKDIDEGEILDAFQYIRSNPDVVKNYVVDGNDGYIYRTWKLGDTNICGLIGSAIIWSVLIFFWINIQLGIFTYGIFCRPTQAAVCPTVWCTRYC